MRRLKTKASVVEQPVVQKKASTKKVQESGDSDETSYWITVSEGNRIRVEVTEYKGKEYVDIRKYYKEGLGWKPTPKGVMIPVEIFNKVYFKLKRIKTALSEPAAE